LPTLCQPTNKYMDMAIKVWKAARISSYDFALLLLLPTRVYISYQLFIGPVIVNKLVGYKTLVGK